MKAPFPWFGGKRRVAHIVWERFGDVYNYVEPFAGSLAVLLERPHAPRCETINDKDCVALQTRILMADLKWKRADELKSGDQIMGFDESNGEPREGLRAPKRYRHWKIGTVEATEIRTRPCYRLSFDDGTTVIASENHLWLAGSHKSGGRGWRWLKTKSLVCNRKNQCSWLLKLCDVVEKEDSYRAGWIGGFFDGEGNLASAPGWRCVAAQNPGIVFDRATILLSQSGFDFSLPQTVRKIRRIEINGGMRSVLRFLMKFRPERLVNNFQKFIPKCSLYGRKHQAVRLVSKEFLGNYQLVAIQTDCRTYVAEGLASHNCFIANFWRALAANPEKVAHYADWPVNEADLHARHAWLSSRTEFRRRMMTDPEYYDERIAGWWVWGLSMWIGGGWCGEATKTKIAAGTHLERPGLTAGGVGVHRHGHWKKRPLMKRGGVGVQRTQLPDLSGNSGAHGKGVDACGLEKKTGGLLEYFYALADRLRRVRVCCGEWDRILGPSPTYLVGQTAVFLDPPYSDKAGRDKDLYAEDCLQVAHSVREWAIKSGENPLMRIALCGYEGEHEMPEDWTVVAWKTNGGYSNQSDNGNENGSKERIWFSPHCLQPQPELF